MLKRNKQVIIRLTEGEYAALRDKANAAGLKISPLIRRMINDCTIKPRPPDSYRELVREIAAVGNNVNQIAHLANSIGSVSEMQVWETTELLRQIWRLVQEKER